MIDIEALELALSKEDASIKLYTKLISQHPNLKELLYFLVSEEEKHKDLINKKIEELKRF
ncbi:MAG TPA: hypothetical protein PKL77_08430 [Candidatus Omnitrophota bacterium]|mgnify:CR=1 FL=1|nr:hypothetical protein [Candidatus Omnitrophota bacterium]HPT07980.1 hypothetical protein [Candidatus Omnitrophota bacterium]